MMTDSEETKKDIHFPRVQLMHGLEGHPGGAKDLYLQKYFQTLCPRMNTNNFPLCFLQQLRMLHEFQPHCVVGSSFGGALSLFLIQVGGWNGLTVLLAPAIGLWDEQRLFLPKNHPPLIIVHGIDDETVPVEHSRRIVRSVEPSYLDNSITLQGEGYVSYQVNERLLYIETKDGHSLSKLLDFGFYEKEKEKEDEPNLNVSLADIVAQHTLKYCDDAVSPHRYGIGIILSLIKMIFYIIIFYLRKYFYSLLSYFSKKKQ